MLKALCVWLKLCTSLTGSATVIDGDTISLMGLHIRLQGIDAEELSEPHGIAARDELHRLIKDGVTCKLTGARSYDRYVGKCNVGIIDVGAWLVAYGFALDCAHYSNGEYRKLEPKDVRSKLIQKPYC